jgi:hypothetical protein
VDNEDLYNFINLNRDSRWPDFKWQGWNCGPTGHPASVAAALEGVLPDAVNEAGEPRLGGNCGRCRRNDFLQRPRG